MIQATAATYRTIKENNGIAAIVFIENRTHLYNGTRSEQVHYNVQIKNVIFGQIQGNCKIKHYGKPQMETAQKYLVFLDGPGLYALIAFQKVNKEDYDESITACKANFNPL